MRVFHWTNRAVIAAVCVWVAPRLAVARPWRPPTRQPSQAVAADKPDGTAPSPKTPKAGATAGPAPLTITVVGDQLRITGDPAAVAQAYQLGRMILQDKGQVSRAFHLQYANATDVVAVLEEWFNGTSSQRQPTINPWMALAMRGRGGRGGRNVPPEPPPEPPRIRAVADAENNTLLVRGTVLDLVAVQRVLETAIDVEPGESEAAMKPFVIGPLQCAVASEVVRVLKGVYEQDLDQATVRGGLRRGRRPMQPLDPSGRPRPIGLTITADDRTNSIIGMAPGPIADGVRKIVGILEDKARYDKKSVELVPTNGIDPNLLQSVIDAIQAKPPQPPSPRPTGAASSGRQSSSSPRR
jgi:hypothetical protein